jgi:hypothetical protein
MSIDNFQYVREGIACGMDNMPKLSITSVGEIPLICYLRLTKLELLIASIRRGTRVVMGAYLQIL